MRESRAIDSPARVASGLPAAKPTNKEEEKAPEEYGLALIVEAEAGVTKAKAVLIVEAKVGVARAKAVVVAVTATIRKAMRCMMRPCNSCSKAVVRPFRRCSAS